MIVEIGNKPVVANALPGETLYFSTTGRERPAGARQLTGLFQLWRALGDPALTLVVCHPTFSAPWSWRHLSRIIFSHHVLQGRLPLLRAFGPQLLRWRKQAPIVVLDFEDLAVINRNHLFLLDLCRFYFKRELPVDRWRVFLKTAHENLPTPRFRSIRRNRERIEKLRPISLGLPLDSGPSWPTAAGKRTDVFFSGRVEGSSSLRARGFAELKALEAEGLVLDAPEAPLPREEFYRRCSEAWLVWSPEGFGWECFRHYEALACASVPLINHPSIERSHPLIGGEHALYYDPEPGGLTRALRAALADKPRLQAIASAGREHVMAHHTLEAIGRLVVESALAPCAREGGPDCQAR